MDEPIHPQILSLSESLTTLEKTLLPLLTAGPLSTSTSTLPLLDRAKLYVLATYALESLLFSSLRLHGIDAKSHEIFKELARVKEYFEKVSVAEGRGKGAGLQPRLDKGAAGRFVRAGLGGGAGKLEDLEGKRGKHTRFDAGEEERIPVVKASEVDDDDDEQEEQEDERENITVKQAETKGKKGKAKRARTDENESSKEGKAERKKAKRAGRESRTGKRFQHLME